MELVDESLTSSRGVSKRGMSNLHATMQGAHCVFDGLLPSHIEPRQSCSGHYLLLILAAGGCPYYKQT